jgi:hypothetical protein
MLESKLWEEAEQKSKVFLRSVMGDKTFEEFIKNGKTEIQSGNIIYELYDSGNVVNKTTNEKYCLVPDRSDYPRYDVIAIKFAWLKYGQKTVERVANRTNLGAVRAGTNDYGRQQDRASYIEFVHYMESMGWAREQVIIDELSTNLVATHSIERGNTGTAIEIRCPAGRNITIMGTNQIPICEDIRLGYSVVLRISDENDNEINGDIEIRIVKIRSSSSVVLCARGPYSLFSLTRQIGNETRRIRAYKTDDEWYRWRSGIHLMGEDMLRINVINSPVDINRKRIKLFMDMDLWVRHMQY